MVATASVPKPAITETVIISQRKHWINIAPVLVACLLLVLFLPLASYYYARHRDAIDKVIPVSLIGSLTLVYLLVVGLIAVLSLWIYRQNRLVLTNHHIVEYTRHGIFDRTVAQFSLIKLQDVSSRQRGMLANMLGFGDVVIETAGEEENFIFAQVGDPGKLADQIMQAHEALADTMGKEAQTI